METHRFKKIQLIHLLIHVYHLQLHAIVTDDNTCDDTTQIKHNINCNPTAISTWSRVCEGTKTQFNDQSLTIPSNFQYYFMVMELWNDIRINSNDTNPSFMYDSWEACL